MANINDLIREIVTVLSQEKAYNLPNICGGYGLEYGSKTEAQNNKRIYIEERLKGKDQLFLLDLSKRIISDYKLGAKGLSKLVLSLGPQGVYSISEITRKNVLNEIYRDFNFTGKMDIVTFCKRIWDLDNMPSTDSRFENASGDIWQHMINNDDFEINYLFEEYLELLTADDKLFINFLEELVHPLVRETNEQLEWVNLLNQYLKNDGYKLSQTKTVSGYLIYKVHRIKEGVNGAVKNLIFASIGSKPKIVMTDSLNNNIKIIENADKCLIYEEPIPHEGLFWNDLVKWWGNSNPYLKDDTEIENSLYKRLLRSLDSPPEKTFFYSYFKLLKEKYMENLPALIPQVYLHYDPYTKNQRNGNSYLSRQRMDFLFIFPNKQRVIIEIDGKQHYSDGNISSPKKYAEMVSADRDIKLQGYELYRFGGYELIEKRPSLILLEEFFNKLLKKHEIDPCS
ncbi:hypothetical protein ABD68_19250 [Bacillus endophyticus]|uniref:AbiJ-related protein n=1 Tax=Priestia endophytica TaxID=135735 RepID=UPI0018CFCAB8|nr:hypothetical protein [Priestia endophytica]MBG9813634.1 hypothetical protein [Priestia endophytica]